MTALPRLGAAWANALAQFGHSSFRPGQEAIIEALLQGRDVLAVMPPMAGKSLCYQLIPVATRDAILVVSPHRSDAMEQLTRFQKRTTTEAKFVLGDPRGQDLARYDAIYMSAMTYHRMNSEIHDLHRERVLGAIVVDEAHMVAKSSPVFFQWYGSLGTVRGTAPIPILATTSAARPEVQDDIIKTLNMTNPLIVKTSFDKPHLKFQCRKGTPVPFAERTTKFQDLVAQDLVNSGILNPKETTAVICRNVQEVASVSKALTQQGISNLLFEPGDDDMEVIPTNSLTASPWKIIVARKLTGYGLEIPAIRHIIHYKSPKSLEQFLAESSLCSLDGMPGTCTLIDSEYERHKMATRSYHNRTVHGFTVTQYCRRQFLLHHIGEEYASDRLCGNCDICLGEIDEDLDEEH